MAHKNSDIISKIRFDYRQHNYTKNDTSISVGFSPTAIFVDDYNDRLLVAGNNMLEIYPLPNLEFEKRIFVGMSPNSINVNDDKNLIYIGNPLEKEYLTIDAKNYKNYGNAYSGGVYPSSIAVSQLSGDIYITNKLSNTLVKVEGSTG